MNTTLAANIINLSVAIATFLAVVVALGGIWLNRKQARDDWEHARQLAKEEREHTQELAQQERQHQNRPIVVPMGELSHHAGDGDVDWNSQYDTTPKALDDIAARPSKANLSVPGTITRTMEPNTQTLTLQNMGDGVALNVHSFLYGPNGGGPGSQYTSWNNGPFSGKSTNSVVYTHGATMLFEPTKVDGTHPLYDSSEQNYRIARLTTTYHDIFGIRHVSIFDYILSSLTTHRWMHVATKSGIDFDLEELDNQRQPAQNKRKTIK